MFIGAEAVENTKRKPPCGGLRSEPGLGAREGVEPGIEEQAPIAVGHPEPDDGANDDASENGMTGEEGLHESASPESAMKESPLAGAGD